jgi:hypothetical protein
MRGNSRKILRSLAKTFGFRSSEAPGGAPVQSNQSHIRRRQPLDRPRAPAEGVPLRNTSVLPRYQHLVGTGANSVKPSS